MPFDITPGPYGGRLTPGPLNSSVQGEVGEGGLSIDYPERRYRNERRYSNESEYAYYGSDMSYMFANELTVPPETRGLNLLKRAAHYLQCRDMEIRDIPRPFYGEQVSYYAYTEDILFVNYHEGGDTFRDYLAESVPKAFCDTFGAALRYRFNHHLDYIQGNCSYRGPRSLYCICVAIPEKISIMEKLCWESMLGANSYYQCMKMREVMSNPSKYGINGTQASASALLLKQTAVVDINGRRFLDEPENGNA